jgi:TonB family protein
MNGYRIHFYAVVALLLTLLSLPARAQTTPPRPAESPKVIRKATDALQASAVSRVEAVYPPLALTARLSGTVFVEVSIDESGHVASAQAFSGHPLLKAAAVEAARGWTFKPTLVQGKPVRVVGTLRFMFNLPGYILRDPERVIERLEQQVAKNPTNPLLHYRLGRAYEDDHQFVKALKSYGRALELKPDYGEARVALGDLNMKLNQYDAALDAYNQAVLLDLPAPTRAGAYRAMAMIYVRREQFQQAVEPFKQAIAIAPQGPMYLDLGLAYLKLGDSAAAMEQYRLLKERNSILAAQLLKQINEAR